MITCCEALVVALGVNVISLAIFAGYTIQIQARTVKLEKKNGQELAEITRLQEQVQELKKQLKNE